MSYDEIKKPKHYEVVPGLESKDIVKLVLNSELCENMTGYQKGCLFSVLKYRLRAGKKDDALKDLAKSDEFVQMGWFEDCDNVKIETLDGDEYYATKQSGN